MGVSAQNGCREMFLLALQIVRKPMPKIRMIEFGNQRLVIFHRASKCLTNVKTIVNWFGVEHISIDLHGKHDSIPYDLGSPLADQGAPVDWFHSGDIVTNFGTIEHIVKGQLEAFANMHDLCKQGGVMVHWAPMIGTKHGDWQYTVEWFEELSKRQGYKIDLLDEFDLMSGWLAEREAFRSENHPVIGSRAVRAVFVKDTMREFNREGWKDPHKSRHKGRRWEDARRS